MSRRMPPDAAITVQHTMERQRLVILTVGVLAVLVGAMLIVGVAVIL